jgi:hypothetical protein
MIIEITYTTAKTLYLFPVGVSYADWTTARVLLPELTGDNLTIYRVDLDTSVYKKWRVYEGATKPVPNSFIAIINIDETLEETKKIPRLNSTINAGSAYIATNGQNEHISISLSQ